MRVYHNIPALFAYNSVNATNNALQKSIQKLSTGLRINSAADDAAGLAISEKMRAQVRGLDMAVRNSQDGISMIQTAEGALNETHSILQRMRELSVQSANDTLTSQDRSYIQLEVDQLKEEISRISTTTQFNKKKLLDGSAAVLWSADKLETKAHVRGALREIDQFGQKFAKEGNFKISIIANPGDAQVQKTDIFKVKHENVIMDVSINTQAGVDGVRVDSLPAGNYTVSQYSVAAVGTLSQQQSFVANTAAAGGFAISAGAITLAAGTVAGASILLEVTHVNTGTNMVTFRAVSNILNVDGSTTTLVDENFLVGTTAGDQVTNLGSIGLATAGNFVALTDNVSAASFFTIGDKFVFGAVGTGGAIGVQISGTTNTAWHGNWGTAAGGTTLMDRSFNLSAGAANRDVHFRNFYLNTANGTLYQSDIVLELGTSFVSANAGSFLASFEAAYIGQVAKGDVQLRDLDKFWDANGRFLIEDPQVITITQGDGKQTAITLNSTDTLRDVESKLNNALAFGLGQARYLTGDTDKFATFVTDTTADTSESVEGTFILRSIFAGKGGELNFAGDEDVIKALSLNVIRQSSENEYRASIADAHSGTNVATNVKVTGNMLYGVLHNNIDVEFDAMANIKVNWVEGSKMFRLAQDAGHVYETILHVADNTTVFQIGANEKEDMGVDIGDMSARALGVHNILVTDRESAARSITVIDSAIDRVSGQRAKLGAYQNRLEHTINNLTVSGTNLQAAESRIRDLDMAKEMMNFTRLNILMQAGNSMLAQANQLPQNVLQLLR